MCVISGYPPGNIKDNCETPEPGTRLDPRCKLILEYADKYDVNADSAFDANSRFLDLIKSSVRTVQDIYLPADSTRILIRMYCNVPERNRDKLPVLIYYHGGGFIWGSVDIFDTYCRKLARETEALVISVDYRLAPEYKFPTAVRDSYSVVKWADSNIADYGGDPGKIIVMGESAGGNLAAVMPLVSRDSCGPQIRAQIIVCGATTFEEAVFPSRQYFLRDGQNYLVSEDYLYRCRTSYLPDSVDTSHPYISPLAAELDGDMPEALVITAQVDPLRDEGKEYARKLRAAGIDVVYLEYEGMIHAFMNFYPFLDSARDAIEEVDRFIDRLDAK
jgi:acetyl esterase